MPTIDEDVRRALDEALEMWRRDGMRAPTECLTVYQRDSLIKFCRTLDAERQQAVENTQTIELLRMQAVDELARVKAERDALKQRCERLQGVVEDAVEAIVMADPAPGSELYTIRYVAQEVLTATGRTAIALAAPTETPARRELAVRQ